MKCMRVDSIHACPSGGWYHFYASERPDYVPKAKEAPQTINAAKMMREWRAMTSGSQFNAFGLSLGVLPEALVAIGAAWAPFYRAWAFPMRDEHGETIGVRLRNLEGFKWAVRGSRQGIFLPEPSVRVEPIAYLPEGPTDAAALLSLGLYAIGRPTNQAGNEQIVKTLRRLKVHKAVVVADNDDMKRLGPREGRPGIEGAQKLKKELWLSSLIYVPPSPMKDVRQLVNNGGTRAMIESDIKNRVWSKR